ncbi:phage tail protein [Mycobacterium paragordonae]|uniref:phage tail protein n=1 Tax=Mycobacterium paragordonae TaxID=1389713 RepID=UPI00105B8AE0|nr:hypothetical protein [Mycobacterium paragordonae]TDL05459.1 hypothetical protein EUA05_17950 [Mycobacterium paragordonae]
MADYNLGRAYGKIEIDYSGDGADRAAEGLDKVVVSSEKADESLTKTQRTLSDTDKQMQTSGNSAKAYEARLNEVRQASESVAQAERNHQQVLLNSKSTMDDIERSYRRVEEAKKRHVQATRDERDAHRALNDELNIGGRVMNAFRDIIPNVNAKLTELGTTHTDVANKSNALAKVLGVTGKVVSLLGPEGRAAGVGLEVAAKGMDKFASSASSGGNHLKNFIADIAKFELAFGKISGLTLGLPSLGGLAGLGGAAGAQGIIEIVDAVRQLSGLLGLLPAAISGAAFSIGTLKIAFRGVGDALKDMMANDPKKFLEDIADMAPAAAQSMLQIAQFRDMFKLGAGAVQQSFFEKIAADIAPLIQNWFPAVTSAMSQVAGIFGDFAHQFAGILQQPATMAAFTTFTDNLAAGLKALQPAIAPLMGVFTQLVTVGSSFFQQIGGNIAQLAQQFGDFINRSAANGSLQAWIQTGINAFGHLVNIVENVASAFNTVMTMADRFGGGGLLGWLDKVTAEFDKWTQSAEGQQTLTNFFQTLRTATDAFVPMLKPLVQGLASLGEAFVKLGIGIAPGWQTFFDSFRDSMAQLGPQIVAMAPALNTFLTGMAQAFSQLMAQVGPQLPQIFQTLANAFVALLPQLPPLVDAFLRLVQNVGPQLPTLFQAVTDALNALVPLLPVIIELTREFVSVITKFVEVIGGVIDGIRGLNDALGKELPQAIRGIWDTLGNFFNDLPNRALDWGKSLVQGLIRGMLDSGGLGGLGSAANSIVDQIAQWFQHSPAKVGPFSGTGYTKVRGRMMVEDMASGMASAQGAVSAAAAATAQAAAGAMSSGTAGAGAGGRRAAIAGGADGLGGALLPDNIAQADTSILSAYLRHEFPENRGLKGLAKDLGALVQSFQSGSNFLMQYGIQQVMQTLTSLPGGNQQTWRKMSPEAFARQQTEDLMRKAGQRGPSWNDVLGTGGPASSLAGHFAPIDVTASSSKEQIQQAIIAAGKARGLDDAAIQTALAVAGAESNYGQNPATSMQGGHYVSGLYQQGPAFGTLDQVNDPKYAINAFYDAFTRELAKNPGNPLLAAVLTQNPQLGSGAQGSKYMQDVMNQLGGAKQVLGQAPTWPQVTGGTGAGPAPTVPPIAAPAAGSIAPKGPLTYVAEAKGWVDGNGTVFSDQGGKNPTGQQWRGPGKLGPLASAGGAAPAPAPPAAAPPAGQGGIGLNPASQATRVPNAPNVEAGIRAIGGLPTLYPTSGPNAYQVPAWAQQLAAAFGLTASTYANGDSLHQMGYAFDFNDPNAPNGPSANKEAFARFIMQNLRDQTLQLIYRGSQDYGIASGQVQGQGQYYTGSGGYQEHTDHVHWGTDVPVLLNGQVPPGSMAAPPGAATGLGNSNVVLPSGQQLNQLVDTNGKVLNVNQQQLQAYLQGNPALASQITAAQQPGAGDQQVLDALNGIDTSITGLKAQDPLGNQGLIQTLQSTQQQIAQNQGFQQGPNALQTFSSFMGGASNVVSSVLQAVQGGLDSLAATQDIADRLVYGVRNTEDVNKIIDNVQKYITFASQVAQATGSVLSMIGGLVGAGGSGDPSGGSQGAAMALSAAGQIAQMISGILQGVNAAIDFGQQVYHIAGTYVGRFLSQLTAGGLGTPLMGDVRFLLNKNTGQLISYSQDNPGNQNVQNVPSWLNQTYDYNGSGNANPGVGQLNIYAGPGQSPHDMMSEAMWLVNSGATAGALAPSNF